MAFTYHCCVCDFEMTAPVEDACGQGPDVRALVAIKGMEIVRAAHTVILTCPNGHTCKYPCMGQSSDSE
jgi:hypothetical protein